MERLGTNNPDETHLEDEDRHQQRRESYGAVRVQNECLRRCLRGDPLLNREEYDGNELTIENA